ncbi:efflux RND transporter periplasmic adaptor subunit [Plastoroseomonas arctica]|uniref:HlyD family efflux transporter periplasmic adaptor subunit n=1 Tax=Plastoroseomonas arctica TaxID=1509237 RepID=A0AAF1K428_9PROT|nr:HlyD family efflux transporter periplasmic adaptor subunit [Plastoroseomonas arctica]MBR0655505.1 HlyD family efflux transporter periplasmic adaptor subunit [Plastoroseomonas arctica]
MLRRSLCAVLIALGLAGTARSHEGHGDEAPVAASALPRVEAESEAFELVGVLQPGGVLLIYLDRWADNAPVDGAVTVTIDRQEVAAARQGIGILALRHPRLAQPGCIDLIFSIAAGEEMDLLTATLQIPEPPASAVPVHGWLDALREAPMLLAAGLGLLLAGLVLGRLSVPRALPPMVEDEPLVAPSPVAVVKPAKLPARVAGILLLIAAAPSMAQTSVAEPPRRMDDGTVFMPKPSQRLLVIRTQVAAPGDALATTQLVGSLTPDPNASGRVQPSQSGRLEPGERGLPTLGQRVERGQVLAYVTPSYTASERGTLAQNAAELDAQITILAARVSRLTTLRGSVSDREISEAQAELAGARQRRAAIQPALSGREPLLAPVSGTVSLVRAALGQIVDNQQAVFEIVDPDRLWVEALAFDRISIDAIAGASATLGDGRSVELEFVGRGLTVRQQAVPLNFRVVNPPPDVAVGAPVVVLLRSRRQVEGIILPAEAVVRSAEGPPIVFEHTSGERFAPRPVRVLPLDGARVVITAGVNPGARIVTQGANLIAQVR